MLFPLPYRRFLCFLALAIWGVAVAQPGADSAKKLLGEVLSDPVRMRTYAFLGNTCYNHSQLDSGLRYSLLALRLAERLDDKEQIVVLNNRVGEIYDLTGNSRRAMESYLRVLKLATRTGDLRALASAYGNLGISYYYRSDYPMALDMQLRALEYFRQAKDTMGEARSSDNIGIVYDALGDHLKALEYHRRCLKWYEQRGHLRGLARVYNNMANIYNKLEDQDQAYDFYLRSLRLHLQVGDKLGYAACLSNLALVQQSGNELAQSVDSLEKALRIQQKIRDVPGEVITRLSLGNSFFALKQLDAAEKQFLASMELCKEIDDRETEAELYLNLSSIYEQTGRSRKALEHYDQYIALHDSLRNSAHYARSVKLEMDYEFESREKAAKVQHEKEVAVEKERYKKNLYLIICAVAALCLSLAIGWYMWRHNRLMFKRNQELAEQKRLVEEKQTEILDSIRYASRIQRALLPKSRLLEKHLQPKP